jgi:hypothetical protein
LYLTGTSQGALLGEPARIAITVMLLAVNLVFFCTAVYCLAVRSWSSLVLWWGAMRAYWNKGWVWCKGMCCCCGGKGSTHRHSLHGKYS